MIFATQRPSVATAHVICDNFPARLVFKITSWLASQIIFEQEGADQLIGSGDLLFSLNGNIQRIQCAFVDTPEMEQIVEYIASQPSYATAYELPEYVGDGGNDKSYGAVDFSKCDPLFNEVAHFVVIIPQVSISSIMHMFTIGYNRACRLMDQLETVGIVGPSTTDHKVHQVLIQNRDKLDQLLDALKRNIAV